MAQTTVVICVPSLMSFENNCEAGRVRNNFFVSRNVKGSAIVVEL
jgi:hypothetical protein